MPKLRPSMQKRYSIGSVAKELNLQTHVIRFWETQFSQIRPITGKGNRRYYTQKDVDLIRKIKQLLHDEGLTIKGLQKYMSRHRGALRNKGVDEVLKEDGDLNTLLANDNAGGGEGSEPNLFSSFSRDDSGIKKVNFEKLKNIVTGMERELGKFENLFKREA